MNNTATPVRQHLPSGVCQQRLDAIASSIQHATRLLPAQGPIRVFVHHNTLHAFEDLTFAEAVRLASTVFGCHAYLPEHKFRQKVAKGRILPTDLAQELIDDLGDGADHLIGFLGTRYHLRLAMLQHPLRNGPDSELQWLFASTDSLQRFREETPDDVRERMIEDTRRWVMRDLRGDASRHETGLGRLASELFSQFHEPEIERWSDAVWESFSLHLLWNVCLAGVRYVPSPTSHAPPLVRHRDLVLEATGVDTDAMVNEKLIPFCAAYLDQGMSHWTMPNRDEGFFRCWLALYRDSRPLARWVRGLPQELQRIDALGWGPLEVIDDALNKLGIDDARRDAYLSQTLLSLRGWAGMIWQMESNAEWTVHPAPPSSLVDYVAVRLLLERFALQHSARAVIDQHVELAALPSRLASTGGTPRVASDQQRAFMVFQLAQVLGWRPESLYQLAPSEWSTIVQEIEAFSAPERRRIYHLAFERRYRTQLLDAVIAHASRPQPTPDPPEFQVMCCIDEREESFRRHLEEVAPGCESFGVAGFFGVAMYYKGIGDAHYVPLCPVGVKPQHYVREEVSYSFVESHRRRTEARRAIGRTSHWLHTANRSVIGGALTAILGSLASVPLVAGVLFPRLTARIRRMFASVVHPPSLTRLTLEREKPTPGSQDGHHGFSIDEMVDIAEQVLQSIGLTRRFARLLIVMGHGSSSLNNPHESAHDCGACGGGRGGPNARTLAAMLSDQRVRERLARRGLDIPRTTVVVGAFHNTCDDGVDYFDLERLPSTHHEDFESARRAIELARRRDAHERCRRFESAELAMSEDAALRHVQGRSEDISQVRPEYGHATNASCFVGRRARTRGLFLDRRAFLASYDSAQDDASHSTLERILNAVIPVCAGINLEYYFSYVDPTGYGCGTKLPHNITSLLGVMDGAASDLRPGLPWQMVEVHEPVRILFVIEATPAAVHAVLSRNPGLHKLVHNNWVQLATLDPMGSQVHVLQHGEFMPYLPDSMTLPVVKNSLDWYRGWRDHLGCATVDAALRSPLESAAANV